MPGDPGAGAGDEELRGTSASRRGRSRRASSGSTGTSRQPRTARPSSAAISLDAAPRLGDRRRRRRAGTRCRRRRSAGVGRSKSTTSRRNASGTWMQDARAVAGVRLGAGGAAVVEVAQGGERLLDDVVAGHAGQGRHEGDATGVVLVAGVVEPLAARSGRSDRVRCEGTGHSPVVVGAGRRAPTGHRRRPPTGRQMHEQCRGRRLALARGLRLSPLGSGALRVRGRLVVLGAAALVVQLASLAAGVGACCSPRSRPRASDEQHDRGPHVEPQAADVVELDVVDAQHLDPAAAERCRSSRRARRPGRGRAGSAGRAQITSAEGPEVPQELVEERRVEGGVRRVARAAGVRGRSPGPRAGRWACRTAPG